MKIHSSESYSIFKKSLLKFIRTITNSVFSVADIYGIKLLTRLRVGLSRLREHKFRYNFQDTINLLCSCSLEIESTSNIFLRCQNFITPRTNLMKELCKLNSKILNQDEISLTKLLLNGDSKYKNNVDKKDNISFHKFHTLYKVIRRPTDATFFLNIYLLGIFLFFFLLYILRSTLLY